METDFHRRFFFRCLLFVITYFRGLDLFRSLILNLFLGEKDYLGPCNRWAYSYNFTITIILINI